jgi:hypothetical protein
MEMQTLETPSNGNPVNDGKIEPDNAAYSESQSGEQPCGDNARESFYSSLREVRAELEDLQAILDSIRKGKTIIPTYAQYIETTKINIQALMEIVNNSIPRAEMTNNVHTIRHLNNAWEQLQVSPLLDQPKTAFDIQQQLHYLDLLDQQIHIFIYQISVITVPNQINEWLKITGPGYFIPFHEVFADDLPNLEDRERLLKTIALTPRLTPGGFVDPESGRIYRYSTNRWRRLLSLGMLLGALGIATGIVAASCFLGANIDEWPLKPADLPKMLVAWAAVLIGMGVHIVVGSSKRSKTQNGMPSVLMDLILIIDARFGEIVMKLLLGLIGLFGLVIISTSKAPVPGINSQIASLLQVTPLNAFLVGYSLDSILELFGTSMEGTSQVKSLMRKSG